MQVQVKKNVLSHFLVKPTEREALGDSEYRNKINNHHITQEKLTKHWHRNSQMIYIV